MKTNRSKNMLITKRNLSSTMNSLNIDQYWFDVDGTLIDNGELTPLGKFIAASKAVIKILTFGPWNKDMLAEKGISAKEVVVMGDAIANGLADFTDDGNISKKVDHLIDNEDHPLSEDVIKVSF